MEDALTLFGRPLLALVRLAWWLFWDVCFHTIPWWIGWPICRVVTFGRFPHAGWSEYEEAGFSEAIIVCGVGLAVLAGALWALSSSLQIA